MPHERRRILEIELPLDVRPVHVDRLRAEMKLRRDVLRALPLPDHLEDLELPVAQSFNGRMRTPGFPPRKRFENAGRHPRADINLPVKHMANRGAHALRTRSA